MTIHHPLRSFIIPIKINIKTAFEIFYNYYKEQLDQTLETEVDTARAGEHVKN